MSEVKINVFIWKFTPNSDRKLMKFAINYCLRGVWGRTASKPFIFTCKRLVISIFDRMFSSDYICFFLHDYCSAQQTSFIIHRLNFSNSTIINFHSVLSFRWARVDDEDACRHIPLNSMSGQLIKMLHVIIAFDNLSRVLS